MSDDALIPVEQKEIEFYGDSVIAVRVEDGAVYVPVKPLCELIGVDWSGQSKRIKNDPILSEEVMSVEISPQTSTIKGSRRPKKSKMAALPLDTLNGWLYGINANRVKPTIREALLRYQRECYRVLFQAFGQNTVTVRPDEKLMQSQSESAIAYRHALAIAKIARQQFYLEERVDENMMQIGENVEQIGRLDERLSLVEANLSQPDAVLSQEQAEQVAGAVKLIAGELGDKSGRNEYGRVYRELYRQFAVTSYKLLPAAKFEQVMGWLRGWWSDVVDDSDCPF